MFSLEPNPTFTAPVDLPVPGKPPVKVMFRFRHMPNDVYWAMISESKAKNESAVDFLARFVDGWEGENINAPFSLESLGKLVNNYPKAAGVIFKVYDSELIGALGKN